MVLVKDEGAGTTSGVTTKLLKVDLEKGVASYIVSVPSYVTNYIVTSIISDILVSEISSLITAIHRSYFLPDGRLYTVIDIPTKIVAGVDTITSLLGVHTQIVTMHHRPTPQPQPPPKTAQGWSRAITAKVEAGML